ncbi:hypothetical protein F4X86_01590 [Candidatus Saccharibacteria bacterium]|nr:hypothetical protein [Candidatus Saccharibacteria bacterium]
MSLFAQLEDELKRALLARDTEKVEVFKLVKSAILLQAKEQGLQSPPPELCQAAIYKQIKAYQEIIDLYRSQNQAEAAAGKEQEMKLLQDLLPAQLGQSELEAVIDQVVDQADLELTMGNFKTLLDLIEERVGLAASKSQIAQSLKRKIEAGHV